MHSLPGVEQRVAVTASVTIIALHSSPSLPSLFSIRSSSRHEDSPPSLSSSLCSLASSRSSSRSTFLSSSLLVAAGISGLRKCSEIGYGRRIGVFAGNNGCSAEKRRMGRMDFRSFASRKDRREAADDSASFEPDIASLRSGFSKRFPNEEFRYDIPSDDDVGDDDGVEVKSFKGGKFGRAQSSSPANDSYGARSWNKPDISSRSSRSVVRDGYERRKAEGNGKTGTGAQYSRLEKETGGERVGSSTNGARSFEETRGSNYTSRSDRSSATRSTSGSHKRYTLREPERRGKLPYGGGVWTKDTPIFEDEEKKKKPVIEPVNFTSAMTKSPHVAILGGGMSGLMCALTLEEHGIESTVFDTGKHGLGGRMGTRFVEEHEGEKLVFDHAAQFFTVTDARFQKQVDRWMSEGAVKEWSGNVGTLRAGGHYAELPHATRYIGTNGMRSLADHMLWKSKRINVKRPCWISSMEAKDGRWKLRENKRPEGEFDLVVIAHNGKCANRLLSTAHVPRVARQMRRLELSSIWALLAAFDEPIPIPGNKLSSGAFVEGVDALSWMGNNSRKLALPNSGTPECWTFFSTAAYGKKNKVPQESIPSVKAQKVKHDIFHGVEIALGLPEDSLPTPVYTRLQLWGAALPMNTPGVPCIFDSQCRMGICGDWLLGSSIEAAALSGMSLADHIAKYRDNDGSEDMEEFSIGLQQMYNPVDGQDIGQFADESPKASPQGVLVGV